MPGNYPVSGERKRGHSANGKGGRKRGRESFHKPVSEIKSEKTPDPFYVCRWADLLVVVWAFKEPSRSVLGPGG